jgi:hypothetical protein
MGLGRDQDSSGYGLDQIFANKGTVTLLPLDSVRSCGTSLDAPNATDGRRIQVVL